MTPKVAPRQLTRTLLRAARSFPAVIVTGPRRAGKTTLLRHVFPAATHHLLEDPATLAAVRADPRGFLESVKEPVIIDEIQNAPELLNFIRVRIDSAPRLTGRWLLTGSQDFALMRGVTESMAGRAAVLELPPLSTAETPKVTALRGGYPEVLARPRDADLWFRSYLQTYLERDVRQVTHIRELATFRRFLGLVASRTGQILNKTDLAAPLGVSIPTIAEWIGILETTSQILVVAPYFENLGKRLIKSPKLYLADSGLACHLLGIDSPATLARSPFAGAIFEGMVAAEIIKQQAGMGRRRELYYFRDQRGLEVDFVVPSGTNELFLIEAKASQTVYPSDARSLRSLASDIGGRRTHCIVVHATGRRRADDAILTPGARAMGLTELLRVLEGRDTSAASRPVGSRRRPR